MGMWGSMMWALALCVAAAPAAARSPFDGVWITDLASVVPRPRAVEIAGGAFRCLSCVPPFDVSADGGSHAVSGQPGVDETAVRVSGKDAYTRANRLRGRIVRVETVRLDAATMTFTDTINPGIAPVSGMQRMARLAAGAAGAHPLSSRWQPAAPTTVSANGLTRRCGSRERCWR